MNSLVCLVLVVTFVAAFAEDENEHDDEDEALGRHRPLEALILRQSIRHQTIAEGFVVLVASACSDDHKLLACALALKRHWGRVAAGGQPRHPQLLAGVFVEGTKAAVIGGRDKD